MQNGYAFSILCSCCEKEIFEDKMTVDSIVLFHNLA